MYKKNILGSKSSLLFLIKLNCMAEQGSGNTGFAPLRKFGSNYVWKDNKNNKLIFVYIKRYAKINYLRFEIKKYVSPDF